MDERATKKAVMSRLDVLLDSCHSGTGTRAAAALALMNTAENSPPVRPRFLAPPMDILCRQLGEDDLPLTRMLKATNPANHVLFSGCRDNQTSRCPSWNARAHGRKRSCWNKIKG